MSDSLMSKGSSEKRDLHEWLAAITTEIFINKKKKSKFIDKDYMCRDPLPSFIGPAPFSMGIQPLFDH